MLMVVCAWALAGAVLCGLGVLGCWLLRVKPDPETPLFWLGFAGALGVLQVWQLFHPVDGCAALALAAVGLPALAAHLWRTRSSPGRRERWFAYAVVGAAAVWFSNLALAGDTNPDSGLYYVATVRWLQEHPLPPGLGNLSYLLALNNAYFLYVALLDVGPFHHQAQHLANGLLLLAVLWHSVAGLGLHFRLGSEVRPSHTVAAVLLPPLLYTSRGARLTGPIADMAVLLLGAMLVVQLVRLLEARAPEEPSASRRILTVLASAGVVMKTSLICVAAPVLLAVAHGVLTSEESGRARWKRLAGLGLLGSLWAVPWMVRGIVLSGYPLFPSRVGGVPVSWRLDPALVESVHRYIRAFARRPGVPVDEVLADWSWVWHWAAPLWLFNWEFLIPALIILGGAGTWIALRRRPAPPGCARAAGLLLLGLGLWFLLAPDLRFAGALLWGLAGVVVARGVHTRGPPTRQARLTFALAALLLAAVVFPGPTPMWVHEERLVPLRETQGEWKRTDSGLELRVVNGGRCFDTRCTQFFEPRLRLRKAGDPGSGFELAPEGR